MHRRDFLAAVAAATLASSATLAPRSAHAHTQAIEAIRRFAEHHFKPYGVFDRLSGADVREVLDRLVERLDGDLSANRIKAAIASQITEDMMCSDCLRIDAALFARTDVVMQALSAVRESSPDA